MLPGGYAIQLYPYQLTGSSDDALGLGGSVVSNFLLTMSKWINVPY